jgi:uncharacterized protein (DUF3084 family)
MSDESTQQSVFMTEWSRHIMTNLDKLNSTVMDTREDLLNLRSQLNKIPYDEILFSAKELHIAVSQIKTEIAVINSRLDSTRDLEEKSKELTTRIEALEQERSNLRGKATILGAVGAMIISALISAWISVTIPKELPSKSDSPTTP